MEKRGWGYRTKRDQLFLKAKVDIIDFYKEK